MILLDVFVSIFEFYIFISFYNAVYCNKNIFHSTKHRYMLYILACLSLIGGVILLRFIFKMSPVCLMAYTLVFLFCLSYLYQAELKERIFYACILVLLGLASELFVGFYFIIFLESQMPEITSADSKYICGTVSSKIIFLLLSRFLSIACRKDRKAIPLAYWFLLVSIPIISIFELHAVVMYAAASITSNNKEDFEFFYLFII